MLAIILTMLAIIILAGLVLVYVAFPHRGEDVPAAPWLGEAMAKAADAAPTLDEDAAEVVDAGAHADEEAPAHRR